MYNIYAPTIFVDLDGTIVKHQGPPWDKPMELLPGVKEQFNNWHQQQAVIVITTGRPYEIGERTSNELRNLGLEFDQLVLGLTSGKRILINDLKPYCPVQATAVARNLRRDEGLKYLVL